MYFFLFLGSLLAVLAMFAVADVLHVRWVTRGGLNSLADWTPVPPDQAVQLPSGVVLTPYRLRLITSHLEPGESLEGFASAYFAPRRVEDRTPAGRGVMVPLLIAATSRRIMLFHFWNLTLRHTCFIPLDDVEYLQPPVPALWGTSGPVRFGLKSGRAYRLQFYGPLFNREGMEYEHRLADYLRGLAGRFPSSPAPRLGTPQPIS
ncbi:MAG TPA: hypothetical protein VI792_05895 [Candidatus Eisenbacteria bacterium]